MNEIALKKPSSALREVSNLVIPEYSTASRGSKIQLCVKVDDHDLVARDLAAYIEFIDHVYGRTTSKDFRSYARKETGHVKFASTRRGSLDLIIEKALGVAGDLESIVILWLVLKYLPAAIHSMSSSFNEYQQGLLARENRKRIRLDMERDDALSTLPSKRRAELAKLVNEIVEKETALLPRVRRFTKNSLQNINITRVFP
jgi:hypothetical protein